MSGQPFEVLGFPSNDFGGQEPGTPAEIATFCKRTYDVSFPLFSKVVTKANPDQSPIYAFLGASGNLPQWNFSKYVIGKNGQVLAFFPSKIKPDDPALRAAIQKALGE
jgi:glutathione peroxidase